MVTEPIEMEPAVDMYSVEIIPVAGVTGSSSLVPAQDGKCTFQENVDVLITPSTVLRDNLYFRGVEVRIYCQTTIPRPVQQDSVGSAETANNRVPPGLEPKVILGTVTLPATQFLDPEWMFENTVSPEINNEPEKQTPPEQILSFAVDVERVSDAGAKNSGNIGKDPMKLTAELVLNPIPTENVPEVAIPE